MPLSDEEKKRKKRESNRKWQKANPEKKREWNRKWQKANPVKVKDKTVNQLLEETQRIFSNHIDCSTRSL